MINQLLPDMARMIELADKLGELRVERRIATEIKRGKMPDENKLKVIRELQDSLFEELQFLKEKWGLTKKKH